MRRVAIAFAACVLAAGCGGDVTQVEGQVVWQDGTPAGDLVGYEVNSEVPGSKVSARGAIGPDGRFKLGTHTADDGAEPGEHKATIAAIPVGDYEPPPKVKLPTRYAKADASGLKFTVESGKKNEVTLTVSRK